MNPHSLFQFVGNDLVLDFVNTRIFAKTQEYDLIGKPHQLAGWLKEVGIQTQIDDWSTPDFARIHDLRDAIQAILKAVISGGAPDAEALAQINSHLEHYATHSQLTHNGTNFNINEVQTNLTPSAAMSFLANRTALLLASTDQNRIKACAGSKCVLVFKDTSKSGRRKWCSMDTCGNRTKAAKYRENGIDL